MPQFDKPMLDNFFAELKSQLGGETNWDDLVKDAHLGIARSDADTEVGEIDSRVAALIKKHQGG
jgi:hypothetical protein